MAGAGGASTRAAPSQLLQSARSTAQRTEAAGGASTRAAESQLQTTRRTASRMEGAGAASRRAAPIPLKAARSTARRMAAADGASMRAASSQSLKLQAACSARSVCGAHSRRPTVRRRGNSQHMTCNSAALTRGDPAAVWRTSHKPAHSLGLLVAVHVAFIAMTLLTQPAVIGGRELGEFS
jgi:hypothetical protein